MATVNLGRVKPIYRGEYSAGAAYQPLDFVRYGNLLYICKQAAPAGTLPTNATYFDVITDQGDIDPGANRIPRARADGTIDLRWLGETAAAMLSSGAVRVNDIGTPGMIGFGAGICPEIAAGYSALPGTFTLGSPEYGNYRYSDGSIMVWVPAFYYRIGHANNPTYEQYGANSIDVKPFSHFVSVVEANDAGYALHRAFYDGGDIVPGFMFDKYGCSNNSGTASSIKNGDPLSSGSAHNPFSDLDGSPANNYSGAIAAAKTRGSQFFPCSRFQIGALALLSLAHGQAAKSAAACAWFDPAGVTNFPKGNNNNALGDINDPTVSYLHDGYVGGNSAKTGSGLPFAKTTHNGQACGIADLNGNMYSISLGMTCIAATKSITAAGQTNPVTLTIASHGYSSGDKLLIASVGGMTQINDRIFEITVVDTNTISLNGVNGTGFSAYTSGGIATKGQLYATKTSVKMEDYTDGNTLATDHWGATGVAATMDAIDLPLRTDYPNNGINQRFGNAANQVLAGDVSGDNWARTGLAVPLLDGLSTSGTSQFGQDSYVQYIRNELCVVSGFHWAGGSYAGVFGAVLGHDRARSAADVGLRCASYPVRP